MRFEELFGERDAEEESRPSQPPRRPPTPPGAAGIAYGDVLRRFRQFRHAVAATACACIVNRASLLASRSDDLTLEERSLFLLIARAAEAARTMMSTRRAGLPARRRTTFWCWWPTA